jgi:hypothetical protein
MGLAGKQLDIMNTWRTLTEAQGYSASTQQVADVMGVSRTYASVVFTRLVKKGHLEHLGRSYYRECLPAKPATPVQLIGTSHDRLVLRIELTGKSQHVIDDVQQAIERLTWFKQSLEQNAIRPPVMISGA